MKNILYFFIGLFIVSGVISCTDDFDEMNTSPTQITEADSPDFFLLGMETYGFAANYQVCFNLYHDLYAQYAANHHPTFNSGYYEHHDGWILNLWKNYYINWIIKNFNDIKAFADEDDKYNNTYQIARIWYYFSTTTMVDTWGDIPYSQVGTDLRDIPYDDAEEIYRDMIAGLKDAVSSFKTEGQEAPMPGYDVIYGGDINKWKVFANSLRAKLALRMVNVDAAFSKQEFESAVADGIMMTTDDDAYIPCDDNWGCELANYPRWGENGLSKSMERILKTTGSVVDPRLPVWFEEIEDEAGGYNGIANGDNVNNSKNFNDYSRANRETFSRHTSYRVFLSGECQLMLAEAKLRGWTVGERSINDLYKEGIKLNMDQWKIGAEARDEYIDGLAIIPDTPADKEGALEQIITQRWLACYPEGRQGWSIVRRTDYPKLDLPLFVSSIEVPEGQFIKRIKYINNEVELNKLCPTANNTQNHRIFWDTSADVPNNF